MFFWQRIKRLWNNNQWLHIAAGFLLGLLALPALRLVRADVGAFLTDLVPEAVGILFTVLILDRLAENRSREDLKERLFNEMRSPAVGQGTAALDWLRREGWVRDSTLAGMDLHRVNWENAYVGGLNLDGANLNGAMLSEVTNQFTDSAGTTVTQVTTFNGAGLRYAWLERAVLIGAQFNHAVMKKAHLKGAVLVDAGFTEADMTGCDLREAKVWGSDFTGATLTGALLDSVMWVDASGTNPARLPDGELWTPQTDVSRFQNNIR